MYICTIDREKERQREKEKERKKEREREREREKEREKERKRERKRDREKERERERKPFGVTSAIPVVSHTCELRIKRRRPCPAALSIFTSVQR
jgi:hypothetical protein